MTALQQGASPTVVGPYLAAALEDPAWECCAVELIAGGRSNLTYTVTSSAGTVVLRRPPLGRLLPSAHDVAREARIMTALTETAVPVPKVLAHCTDSKVLGQPFYVMEKVEGHICRATLPQGYADAAEQRSAIGQGLVRVLGDLHEVEPAQVGLADLGRPVGYLERQVVRWQAQWEATRLDGHDALAALQAELVAAIPTSNRAALVHGDYRLDNAMLHATSPGEIAAVLDWEMATLGDPLVDLGLLLVYWAQADDGARRASSNVVPSVTGLHGFPTRAEIAELYALRTGSDLTDLPWAQAFGFYKLAVVCAGIIARANAGDLPRDDVDIEIKIGLLVELGRAALADGDLV